MPTKFDWCFKPSGQNPEAWESLCPTNEYRVVPPFALPTGIIPPSLQNKCDSVVVMSTALNDDTTAYLANMNRVDYNASSVDQQPFILGFKDGQPLPSACLIHHPKWHNRTTPFSPDFVEYIKSSGYGNCYPIAELPSKSSGALIELDKRSQQEALTFSIESFTK